ncbi:twin-arginine translocation signal domain-containing protein, partial [Enterobacteriaceae bacterium 8376wG6]|nr:twin-arginine translocation signal domain-containing protein [Enterobacteriaceae bacterium 8376wG6]
MATRRTFIKQLSSVAGVGLAASLGISLHGHAKAALNPVWRLPDEGEPQQRAFLAFGAQRAIWGGFTADVQAAQGRIARAIAE